MSRYDALVVGGGPAGATAGLTLARLGASVAILERSWYDAPRVGEALPPSAHELLRELDLEELLTDAAAPSFGNRSVWSDAEPRDGAFVFHPHGVGWHLDRGRFDRLLAQRASAAGASLHQGAVVKACAMTSAGSWLVETRVAGEARLIEADAVIDASGRGARIARSVGATRMLIDRLIGVTARYGGGADAGAYTLVEAVADGWWYSAPVPPDTLVVAFMTDADLWAPSKAGGTPSWERRLAGADATRARLAGWALTGEPRTSSAVSHRLRRTAEGPWTAAGDAAIAVDPLSASGIERALLTGHLAAHAVAHALAGRSGPLGDYERRLDGDFSRYARERDAYYALERRWPDAPFWRRRHVQAQADDKPAEWVRAAPAVEPRGDGRCSVVT